MDAVPLDDCGNHRLHAVAMIDMTLPFRNRVINVDELDTYRECPPGFREFLENWLDRDGIVAFTRVAANVATMHASIAKNIAADAYTAAYTAASAADALASATLASATFVAYTADHADAAAAHDDAAFATARRECYDLPRMTTERTRLCPPPT